MTAMREVATNVAIQIPVSTAQGMAPGRRTSWAGRALVGLGAVGLGGAMLTLGGTAALAHILTRPRRLRAVAIREIDDTIEAVTFRTADRLTLHGWYLPHPAPRDALVIAHGYAMNRHELLDLAGALRARGHAVLLFDFRAHGVSDGVRSTIGYREAEDIIAAVAHLRARPELAALRIGVAGISMGAAAALLAAAREPAIAAVAADSSFATLQGIAVAGLGQLSRLPAFPFAPLIIRFGELLTHARIAANRPIDAVGALAPRPLLLIHGAEDRFVPPDNAHALRAAAGPAADLWLVPGLGHASTFALRPDEYVARLDRFFAAALGDTWR